MTERRNSALQTCVLKDNNPLLKDVQNKKASDIKINEAQEIWHVNINDYKLGNAIALQSIEENQTVVVSIKNKKARCLEMQWARNGNWIDKSKRIISIYDEDGEAEYELSAQDGLNYICFWGFDDQEDEVIDSVDIAVYNTEEYYRNYIENSEILRKNSLQISKNSEDKIEGEIEVNENGILFLAIPFEAPYKYQVDGEEVNAERVNQNFSGIYLDKGKHKIRIEKHMDFSSLFKKFILCIFVTVLWTTFEKVKAEREKNEKTTNN